MNDTPETSRNSSTALEQLRQLIQQQEHSPDRALPTERELA